MFKRHSSFMKFSALTALAAFSLTSLRTAPASAYSYGTHSRIAELAVHAMSGFCFGVDPNICNPPLLLPPKGEESLWGQYMNDVSAASSKLPYLKTGLPTSTVDGGFSPVPGDSDDTTGYPYSAKSPNTCRILANEKRDLNRLNDFRIMDLDYLPNRKAEPCGLSLPDSDIDRSQGAVTPDPARVIKPAILTERMTELVLGWQGAGVDDHVNDVALWVRPTLVGIQGLVFEAASWVWEAGVGTILLPFALLWSLFSGNDINLDATYALARQYNPVDEIQGAIPGIGDIRSSDFTGLWHFEAVDAGVNRFNDTRGMWYPGAGPSSPGALDFALMTLTQATGLSLNANIAEGPSNYGGFDKIHRTWPQWQAHSIGVLEWSPLHNLAAYGWSRFKSNPTNAAGLGWPIHAIGDACEPHHVTSTTAWGHRPYESYVEDNLSTYLGRPYDKAGNLSIGTQQTLDGQLADALVAGFRWWKQFNNGEDMQALIHDLAVETRQEIKAQGDWPFNNGADSCSTLYQLDTDLGTATYGSIMSGHEADARRLLTNAIGATVAVLAVAAKRIPTPLPGRGSIDCPTGQSFVFEQHTRHVQPSRGAAYDQVYTVPTCGAATAALPPNPTPSSLGIGQFGASTCAGGAACKANGADCTSGAECASAACVEGSCGKGSGSPCSAPLECASGMCSANGICVSPNGWACSSAAACSSGVCSDGTCGQPGGGTCSTTSDCASGTCSAGKCLSANGGTCTSAANCAGGQPCISGICGKPNGDQCTSPAECASNLCSSSGHCGKGFGMFCSSSSECENNNCINGQCGPGS